VLLRHQIFLCTVLSATNAAVWANEPPTANVDPIERSSGFISAPTNGPAATTTLSVSRVSSQEQATSAETDQNEDDEVDEIATDRPDFTESSSNVPVGRLQIESGYTFVRDHDKNSRLHAHSFPELLMRYGLTDEIELRLGWNYLVEDARHGLPDLSTNADGAADLYLAVGLALSKQKGCWPEAKINLQSTLPTGANAFSADKVNGGFNLLIGWDLSDFISVGASLGVNTITEEDDDFVQYHNSWTVGYSLTDQLGAYIEWFGIYRTDSATNAPENYLDGGFTYKVTPDIQLDIRAGVGLNRHAHDFFTGTGVSIRF
jgi:hypothetical protein